MKNKKGFTLIELLAVIVILGLILVLVVPQVSNYIGYTKEKTMRTEAETYITAVKSYCTANNIFPYKGYETVYPLEKIINDIGVDRKTTKSPYGNEWDFANSYVVVRLSEDYKDTYAISLCDVQGFCLMGAAGELLVNEDNVIGTEVVDSSKVEGAKYTITFIKNIVVSYTGEDGNTKIVTSGSVNVPRNTQLLLTLPNGDEIIAFDVKYVDGTRLSFEGNELQVGRSGMITRVYAANGSVIEDTNIDGPIQPVITPIPTPTPTPDSGNSVPTPTPDSGIPTPTPTPTPNPSYCSLVNLSGHEVYYTDSAGNIVDYDKIPCRTIVTVHSNEGTVNRIKVTSGGRSVTLKINAIQVTGDSELTEVYFGTIDVGDITDKKCPKGQTICNGFCADACFSDPTISTE